MSNGKSVAEITKMKSKFFYENLVNQIEEPPHTNTMWLDKFHVRNIDFEKVYCKKVGEIKDLKLAENNYKILLNILPCGKNLLKWKKSTTDECSICRNVESVTHLIYECQYARQIWATVERVLDTEIRLEDVVLGTDISNDTNFIVSLVVFLIYKEWLILSLENKKRKHEVSWKYLKNEINWYAQVYGKTTIGRTHVESLNKLYQDL